MKNPWEIEDLLTAVVFGSCEDAGKDGWTRALYPFLAMARNSPDLRKACTLGSRLQALVEVEDVSYSFWRCFDPFQRADVTSMAGDRTVEISIKAASPDLIVRLKTRKGDYLLLIEVKLNAGKGAGPSPSPNEIGDQLAKYWEQLKDMAGKEKATALAAIYVTPWSYPDKEIRETRRELKKSRDPDAPIFWVSWRDFVSAVTSRDDADATPLPPAIRRVCDLLEKGWGFIRVEIEEWPSEFPVIQIRPVSIDLKVEFLSFTDPQWCGRRRLIALSQVALRWYRAPVKPP